MKQRFRCPLKAKTGDGSHRWRITSRPNEREWLELSIIPLWCRKELRMRSYHVVLNKLVDVDGCISYQIAILPEYHVPSAIVSTIYTSWYGFIYALRTYLHYGDREIAQLAALNGLQMWRQATTHPLSDDNAQALGWSA